MPPSQSNDGTPQFSQLWPTQFMSLRLPGNETANPVLADFVLAQNIQNDDMTVDYTADNIFVTDHPALIWLRQCCDRAVLTAAGTAVLAKAVAVREAVTAAAPREAAAREYGIPSAKACKRRGTLYQLAYSVPPA